DGQQTEPSLSDATAAALRCLASTSEKSVVLVASQSSLYSDRSSSSRPTRRQQKRAFELSEQRLSDIFAPEQGDTDTDPDARGPAPPPSSQRGSPAKVQTAIDSAGGKPHLPSTLMPVCYASNDTCNERTRGCSGHGACYRKGGSKSSGKGKGKGKGKDSVVEQSCFACRCEPTVLERYPDGRPKKTVHWGGPACQKKDVSSPFFIFVALSALLALGVVGAVRLLFGMGQEELPSVLSAGVAARPQK
ncbi:hypothetical protein KEM52_002097, partial [Ascosphaera acerosa]